MQEDHGRRRLADGFIEHLPGMDQAARQTPFGDSLFPDDRMLGIEENHLKQFAPQIPHQRIIMLKDRATLGDDRPGRQRSRQRTFPQLNGCFDLGHLGRADTRHGTEFLDASIG